MYYALVIYLIVCQFLDGILTYCGITHFGIHAEGNFLIKFLIGLIGVIPTLILVKSLAVILLLSVRKSKEFLNRKIMKTLMIFLSLLYSFAVISWIWVLVSECGYSFCL